MRPSQWTSAQARSEHRLDEFISLLTTTLPSGARVVQSAGGAAGGVISEGQGYGLLAAAAALAAMPPAAPSRVAAVGRAFHLFLGWRTMCEATRPRRDRRAEDGPSTADASPPLTSCQQPGFLCSWHDATTASSPIPSRCLPSWKFDSSVTREDGTGSAPDGDEDSLLGMIVLLLATRDDTPRPSWWEALHTWAFETAASFLHHATLAHPSRRASNGAPLRVLKLGSCWGGFDCTNPSYLAPAHYRVFRDFMAAAARDGRVPASSSAAGGVRADGDGPTSADDVRLAWDSLIEGSYAILADAVCPANGLVPNWFVPSQGDLPEDAVTRATAQWPGWTPGSATCSGSGTPAAEFGAEASRTVWRVALDALWHATPEAVAFCRAVAATLIPKVLARNASSSPPLDKGAGGGKHTPTPAAAELDAPPSCRGRVESVHAHWSRLGFMLGPMAPALMVPLPAEHMHAHSQQHAVDVAATLLDGMGLDDYYSGSWVTLGTLTLDGPLSTLGPLLASLDDADAVAAARVRTLMRRAGAIAAVAFGAPLLLWLWRRVCARGVSRSRGVRQERFEERQPLSVQEEWSIFYDRSGRPYWSDGRGRTTWDRPPAVRRDLSPLSVE